MPLECLERLACLECLDCLKPKDASDEPGLANANACLDMLHAMGYQPTHGDMSACIDQGSTEKAVKLKLMGYECSDATFAMLIDRGRFDMLSSSLFDDVELTHHSFMHAIQYAVTIIPRESSVDRHAYTEWLLDSHKYEMTIEVYESIMSSDMQGVALRFLQKRKQPMSIRLRVHLLLSYPTMYMWLTYPPVGNRLPLTVCLYTDQLLKLMYCIIYYVLRFIEF
jgi:hypothetical protein